MEDCSPNELFDNILPFDGNVELIGLVDGDSVVQTVKTFNGDTLRFKGVLTNNSWRVQITVWGDDIDKVKPFFKKNNILHIDGAFAQERNTQYSLGNVNIDLTYRSNTSIQIHAELLSNKISYKEVHIERVEHCNNQHITVEGYILSEFTEDKVKGVRMLLSSICFEDTRLEIRTTDLDALGKYEMTSHIKVSGLMKSDTMPYYLLIDSCEDISVLPGSIDRKDLRRAIFLPGAKRKRDVTLQINDNDGKKKQQRTEIKDEAQGKTQTEVQAEAAIET